MIKLYKNNRKNKSNRGVWNKTKYDETITEKYDIYNSTTYNDYRYIAPDFYTKW